jgi:hypothetical protein
MPIFSRRPIEQVTKQFDEANLHDEESHDVDCCHGDRAFDLPDFQS